MALSKFNTDMNIISALATEPNDVGGLTDAELKAKFDAGPNAIKAYINDTLTSEIDAQKATKEEVQGITLGQIPDGTITEGKLAAEVISKIDSKAPKTITGIAAPTASTVGIVGQLYLNTNDGAYYKCTAISNGVYNWLPIIPDAIALRKSVALRVATTLGAIATGSIIKMGNGYSFKKITDDYHAANSVTLEATSCHTNGFAVTTGVYSGSSIDSYCINFYNSLPTSIRSLCMDAFLSDWSLTRKCFVLSRAELIGGIPYYSSDTNRTVLDAEQRWTRTFYSLEGSYYQWYYVLNSGGVTNPSGYQPNYKIAPCIVLSDNLIVYLDPDGKYYLEQRNSNIITDITNAEFAMDNKYVKLKDIAMSSDASQLDIDMSDIDLSKHAMLQVYITYAGTTADSICVRVNNDGSMNYHYSDTMYNFSGSNSERSYAALLGMRTYVNVAKIDIVPYKDIGVLSGSILFRAINTDVYQYYIHSGYGTYKPMKLDDIKSLNFVCSTYQLKKNSRFIIYGVKL